MEPTKSVKYDTLYVYRKRALKWVNVNKQVEFLWKLFRTCLIIGISFVILFPLLQKAVVGFKSRSDLYDPNIVWIPKHFSLHHFQMAYKLMKYPEAFLNTLTLSSLTMIMQTVAAAIVGYGFAKVNLKIVKLLFSGVILTILVPPQLLIIPTYFRFRNFDIFGIFHLITDSGLNLLLTPLPIIFLSLTANGLKSGLFIYIFRQFFKNMPKELEEAALVDGAGFMMTFMRIIIPISIPAIVTVLLFSFVWQWNDSFYSSVFLGDVKVMSSALSGLLGAIVAFYKDSNGSMLDPLYIWAIIGSGILLSMLPLIILYMFVQRYFVESVERTGIVG